MVLLKIVLDEVIKTILLNFDLCIHVFFNILCDKMENGHKTLLLQSVLGLF